MAISNRAAIITKTHKVLKKHFKPVVSGNERTLLENLLYAPCLVDATYEQADDAFARVRKSFFDWNEVRVTTVAELAEVVGSLPNPSQTASSIKGTLQSVFEATYSFDLEALKKQNIGQAVKQLAGYKGVSRFATAYVTQHSLGGHAIPLDDSSVWVMYIVGAIDQAERDTGTVPGLERAIPKKKGIEFASLLHQLGAQLKAFPLLPLTREILLEIAPDAQPRLPKRGSRKSAKRGAAGRAAGEPQAAEDKQETKKTASKGQAEAKKKMAAAKKPDPATRKTATSKASATKQLAKRKPR